jgi:hypothetical protein
MLMNKMNIRERIEAFWAGERPDEIPLTIYHNEWRHTASNPSWFHLYQQGLGITVNLTCWKQILHGDIEQTTARTFENGRTVERRSIKTPLGEIYEVYVDDWRQKFFLKTAQDYAVMSYVVRHTDAVPDYETFHRKDREMQPYGIPLSETGRTPNQVILVDWVGLENYAYHLVDLVAEMQELYQALLALYRKKVEIVAGGPGRYVAVLENFTAETLGPARYKKLLLPVYEELFPVLQGAGKIVGTHYDGKLAACKGLIAQAPINLIESLTPPPEGDMTLAECRAVWPAKLFWSNINVGCYRLPPKELEQLVLDRVAQAAPDGRRLAFEISEQYPDNWVDSIPVVLQALRQTRA